METHHARRTHAEENHADEFRVHVHVRPDRAPRVANSVLQGVHDSDKAGGEEQDVPGDGDRRDVRQILRHVHHEEKRKYHERVVTLTDGFLTVYAFLDDAGDEDHINRADPDVAHQHRDVDDEPANE